MSKRYGDEKASAVEITPMDKMVLLVMRGRGCVDGAADCACFIVVASLLFYANSLSCSVSWCCVVLRTRGNVIVRGWEKKLSSFLKDAVVM